MTNQHKRQTQGAHSGSPLAGKDVELVNAQHFVEAFRRLGVTLVQAFCEIIDNAIDASAKRITIVTKRVGSDLHVYFSDDGDGMPDDKIDYVLQVGNRLGKRGSIGRFGWGLKAASASQADKVKVYSKTAGKPWKWTFIDFAAIEKGERPGFPHSTECAEPAEFSFKGSDSGTLVVWEGTERMDPNTPMELQNSLVSELGRIYRKFLSTNEATRSGKRSSVTMAFDGKTIEPFDPLYLTPGAKDFDRIGPSTEFFRLPPMKFRNPEKPELEGTIHFRFAWIDRVKVETAALKLAEEANERIAQEAKKGGRQRRFTADDFKSRLKINSEGQGFSVIRDGREIDWGQTLQVLNKRPDSNYFRAEIMFDTDLDEAFGINMNKSRFFIHSKLKEALKKHFAGIKGAIEIERAKGQRNFEAIKAAIRESEYIAAAAEKQFRKKTETKNADLELKADLEKAESESKAGKRLPAEVEALRARIDAARKKKLPFILEFESSPGAPFYRPVYRGETSVVYVNTASAFYRDIFEPSKGTAWEKLVELMLLSISRAEIEELRFCEENADRVGLYEEMRKDWTTYIESYLAFTSDGHKPGDDEREIAAIEAEEKSAE